MGDVNATETLAELERTRTTLRAIEAVVERSARALPSVAGSDWSGPAAWAFRVAVRRLRREIVDAAGALHETERLTDVAARELAALRV